MANTSFKELVQTQEYQKAAAHIIDNTYTNIDKEIFNQFRIPVIAILQNTIKEYSKNLKEDSQFETYETRLISLITQIINGNKDNIEKLITNRNKLSGLINGSRQ